MLKICIVTSIRPVVFETLVITSKDEHFCITLKIYSVTVSESLFHHKFSDSCRTSSRMNGQAFITSRVSILFLEASLASVIAFIYHLISRSQHCATGINNSYSLWVIATTIFADFLSISDALSIIMVDIVWLLWTRLFLR